ncbi:MAG: hypothetical protein P8Z31_07785 [Gammaproteobacteria bacterium]|jgi:hypothetical protein
MLMRLITGVALATLGYYIGKQVGRNEHIREALSERDDGSAQQTGEMMEEDDGGEAAGN